MRLLAILLAALSCLLALCNATYVSLSIAPGKFIRYENEGTSCMQVDPMFNGTKNQVFVAGSTTMLYARDDCSFLVSMAYTDNPWFYVYNPIRSATYIKLSNMKEEKFYDINTFDCITVPPIFTGMFNQFYISGGQTELYANADCTYVVAVGYRGNSWYTVLNPIRSFRVLKYW